MSHNMIGSRYCTVAVTLA